jgi:hypothetical protein
MRKGRAGERANEQAHSLSLTNACNPYYEHTPLVQDNTSRVSPLCSISRQLIWAGAHSDKFTRRSRDPPGPKRRQYQSLQQHLKILQCRKIMSNISFLFTTSNNFVVIYVDLLRRKLKLKQQSNSL